MDLVLSMDNLIEYSSNYSKATGNLWFYSEDEETNFNADVANNNNFRSFKFIFSSTCSQQCCKWNSEKRNN